MRVSCSGVGACALVVAWLSSCQSGDDSSDAIIPDTHEASDDATGDNPDATELPDVRDDTEADAPRDSTDLPPDSDEDPSLPDASNDARDATSGDAEPDGDSGPHDSDSGDAGDVAAPWEPGPCTVGTCCADGLIAPQGEACAERPTYGAFPSFDVERRCSPGGIEVRYAFPGCDGIHPNCRFHPDDFAWTEWTLEAACSCSDLLIGTDGTRYPGARCTETTEERIGPEQWQMPDGTFGYAPAGRRCHDPVLPGGPYVFNNQFCTGDGPNTYRSFGYLFPLDYGVTSGSSADCPYGVARKNWRSGIWTDRTCPFRQECVEDADGARCTTTERSCSSGGPCCDLETGLISEAGVIPDACAAEEFRCDGDTVQRRDLSTECRGHGNNPERPSDDFRCHPRAEQPWIDVAQCEDPRICVDDPVAWNSDHWCPVKPGGCFPGTPCCDESTRTFGFDGEPCGETTFTPFAETGGHIIGTCLSENTGYRETAHYEECEEDVGCVERSEPLVYTCPDGMVCYDGGPEYSLQGSCFAEADQCDPASPCCSASGFPRTTTTYCTDPVVDREACSLDGTTAIHEVLRGYCDAAGICNDTAEALRWKRYELDRCAEDEVCRLVDGRARCVGAGAMPCDSGECCAGGYTLPAGRQCGDSEATVQTRCATDGRSVERRVASQSCDGESAICSTRPEDYVWMPWSDSASCSDGTTCDPTRGTIACTPDPAPCDSGACCDTSAEMPSPVGTNCGIRWRLERACNGDYVQSRDIDYACDGVSPLCPRDRSRVLVGSWTTAYACRNCRESSGTFECASDEQPGSTAECGAACLIDATCGGGNCLSGQCAPDACASCWNAGLRCEVTSECGFVACTSSGTSGGGGAGCSGNDDVIRRTGLTVGGVAIDTFDVRPRVVQFLGEPLQRIDYRYEASTTGTRLGAQTQVWVGVRGPSGATWYIHQSLSVPNDRTWTSNISGSPPGGWGGVFCGGPAARDTCMDGDSARDLFNAGLCFTGFVVTAS